MSCIYNYPDYIFVKLNFVGIRNQQIYAFIVTLSIFNPQL